MIILINADHRGRDLAKKIAERIESSEGHRVINLVSKTEDPGDDYPLLAGELCDKLLATEGAIGILICGSGIGMSIAANRNTKIRAAVCVQVSNAIETRKHQDANVLCLGADYLSYDFAWEIIVAFMGTKFLGQERQIRRIKQMEEMIK